MIKESCSGKRLKLAFMQSHYFKLNQSSTGEPEGLEVNLLKCLSRTLNFTYEMHEIQFGQYGAILPNGTWSGVVGHLASNKSHFALSGLTQTQARKTVIDFSSPYIKDSISFFAGVGETKISQFLLLSPFQINVWLVQIACLIFVLILVYFLSQPQSKYRVFMSIFGIAVKQSVNVNIFNVLPLSFMVTSWLLSCAVFTIQYGNALKASTSISNKDSINTLDDLVEVLKSGRMKVLIPEHTAIKDILLMMPSKPYGDIFRKASLVRPNRKTDYADIYAGRLTSGSSRLRMELRLLKAGYPPAKIRVVGEPLAHSNTAIGFRMNFTCQASFNWVVVALSESGCLRKWKLQTRWPVTFQEMKEKEAANEVNYIRLVDLQSTFALLLISYLSSMIFFIIEKH